MGSNLSRRELLGGVLAAGCLRGQGLAARPRLIDVHHHIVPPGYLRDVGTRAIGEPAGRTTAPDWSAQISIEAMDRIGIQTSLVSISAPGFPFKDPKMLTKVVREANDFAKQLKTDHPGRFGIFAAMPLPDTKAAIAEAVYALDVLKAEGIGLLTNYSGQYLGDPQFAPFFDELNRRKAVVYVHPTPCVCNVGVDLGVPPATAEYPHDTTRTITSLLFSGTLDRCPNVKFIFSHAGGTLPFVANRIAGRKDPKVSDGMALVKKLYYDTAQSMNSLAIPTLLSFAGASQVVFGSDFPFVNGNTVNAGVMALPALVSGEQNMRMIARDNVLGLLPQLKS